MRSAWRARRRRPHADGRDASRWRLPVTDVLLTHSYHLPYDAKQLRKMQPYAPIGTLYAATALRERGITVAIFDSMLEPPTENFLAMLQELQPKIVAVY